SPNAGHDAYTVKHALKELASSGPCLVAASRQIHLEGEYVLGLVSEGHLHDRKESPDRNARADQENHRQSDLPDDQERAKPPAYGGSRRAFAGILHWLIDTG